MNDEDTKNLKFKADFNSAVRDINRISNAEDMMISGYVEVLENPLKLPLWIKSIDTFYLLLYPHMIDKDTNKPQEKVGGKIVHGRNYFEREIKELWNDAIKAQKKNMRYLRNLQKHKIIVPSYILDRGRRIIQELLLVKKFLGIEMSVKKQRSLKAAIRDTL